MYGSAYSGDVTGDGASPDSDDHNDYVSTVTANYDDPLPGPGNCSDPIDCTTAVRGVRRQTWPPGQSKLAWPDLVTIAKLLQPEEPMITNGITQTDMQLTSNALGSGHHAAEALIRNVVGRVAGFYLDPTSVARGVAELDDVVAIAATMVYITANRIALRMFDDHDAEATDEVRPSTIPHAFNAPRLGTSKMLRPCKLCNHSFSVDNLGNQ